MIGSSSGQQSQNLPPHFERRFERRRAKLNNPNWQDVLETQGGKRTNKSDLRENPYRAVCTEYKFYCLARGASNTRQVIQWWHKVTPRVAPKYPSPQMMRGISQFFKETKMTTPVVIDPFDAATEAKALFGEFFGECVLDAWNCVLEKGIGKRPFDPNVDAPDIRQTAIDIVILPISEQNLRFPLERKLLAESSAWTGITWPSLQKLGLNHAKEARNRFVKVRLAPTGRTWVGKDGQKKQETTFEFVSLFANEDECRASYLGRNGNGHAPAASSAPAAQATSPVPATNANTSDSTRTTALTFAKAIIANLARQEKDLMELQKKVSEKIATQPVVNKYFTGDSPEVMQMIAEALG